MGCLEEKFLDSFELRPWVWWRYSDDVLMIWLQSEKELDDFLTRLNSFHESVKFTWQFSTEGISLLDA